MRWYRAHFIDFWEAKLFEIVIFKRWIFTRELLLLQVYEWGHVPFWRYNLLNATEGRLLSVLIVCATEHSELSLCFSVHSTIVSVYQSLIAFLWFQNDLWYIKSDRVRTGFKVHPCIVIHLTKTIRDNTRIKQREFRLDFNMMKGILQGKWNHSKFK